MKKYIQNMLITFEAMLIITLWSMTMLLLIVIGLLPVLILSPGFIGLFGG